MAASADAVGEGEKDSGRDIYTIPIEITFSMWLVGSEHVSTYICL
jgi:hypothetical protein